jgi:hypothetical protein
MVSPLLSILSIIKPFEKMGCSEAYLPGDRRLMLSVDLRITFSRVCPLLIQVPVPYGSY